MRALEKLNDHFQYVILLQFIFKNIKYNSTNHLLFGYSQFAEIRSWYSNRAVTYFNTTVSKYSCTLIKQSVLKHKYWFWKHNFEHNRLDFWAMLKSIIGKILSIISRGLKMSQSYNKILTHRWLCMVWILENWSKSHIRSFEINSFKDLKLL